MAHVIVDVDLSDFETDDLISELDNREIIFGIDSFSDDELLDELDNRGMIPDIISELEQKAKVCINDYRCNKDGWQESMIDIIHDLANKIRLK